MNPDKLWKAALGQLELRVSQGNFLTWFRGTKIKEVKNDLVEVETPSTFAHEWLARKYQGLILEVLQNLDTHVKEVRFSIQSQIKNYNPVKKNIRVLAQKNRHSKVEAAPSFGTAHTTQTQTLTQNTAPTLNAKYTFDTFVIGPNNEVAHAACRAVASNPGATYNPLFIYGGVGLGKTHLMHAVGNAIFAEKPQTKIMYVASEKFINEFVVSIRDRNTQKFKDRYRNVDVLIIDDVQFLAGKGKTQEELFHTFNALYGQNKQIVLSSDRQPRAIPTFEERLRSRLTGGMIVDIQQPNYETRLAILEEKAARSDIKIEGGALAFIAKNIQKNVRELEGALSRVIVYCELNKSTATLEYTKKILEGILDKPQKSIDSNKIIETVSVYYSLSFDELKGKCRKQDIVRPRQIAMYLLRKENSASFPSIGHQFGGRDHTTAMHACEKIEKLLEHDEELLQDINFIKERLYA
ncbi:MAG: chromosomal replication initiator protein DnaA [bacterium]|nr:chromosomal replication initiator protein DnaA [bacterium]